MGGSFNYIVGPKAFEWTPSSADVFVDVIDTNRLNGHGNQKLSNVSHLSYVSAKDF